MVISNLVACATLPFSGYIYDLLGRRCVIIISSFGAWLAFILIPYSAPNYYLLVLLKTMNLVFSQVSFANPLILDYILSRSQGIANALVWAGFLFGELFNMVVLFGFSVDMDIDTSYKFASIVNLLLTCILPILIREPEISTEIVN